MCETTNQYIPLYILICHMARLAEQRYSSATRNQVIFVAAPILQIRLLPWTSTLQHSGPIFTATGGASSSIISSLSTTDSNQSAAQPPWGNHGVSPPCYGRPSWQFWCSWEASSNSSTCACTLALKRGFVAKCPMVNRWPNGNNIQ